MNVTLTWFEWTGAIDVGVRRFEQSCVHGLNHASTYQRGWLERLWQEVVGAAGERAFAKARGTYWDGSVNTFHHVPDVGQWEVRATDRPDGSLIIRDNDDPSRWYALVIADPPRFTIAGAILGAHARRPEWLRDPHGHRPSWFVPQSALVRLGERAA